MQLPSAALFQASDAWTDKNDVPIVFAHFSSGHSVTYVLYAVPVVVVFVSVVGNYLRERGISEDGPESS